MDLDIRHRRGQRLRRPVRGQGRAQEEGHATERRSSGDDSCSATERETFVRETWISSTDAGHGRRGGTDLHGGRSTPHGEWATELTSQVATGAPVLARGELGPQRHGRRARRQHGPGPGQVDRPGARGLECDNDRLKAHLPRSLVDLAALRFSPLTMAGHSLPAAGLPWFMTVFGRDSIFTSLQALAVHPGAGRDHPARPGGATGHAASTTSATRTRADPPRDALRRDDGVRGAAALALLRLRRRHPALRGPAGRVRAVDRRHPAGPGPRVPGPGRPQLDRRVRRPPGERLHRLPAPQREDRAREPVLEGLVGLDLLPGRELPGFPRATCELQGYAYDAKVRGARLARLVWQDPPSPTGSRARRPT